MLTLCIISYLVCNGWIAVPIIFRMSHSQRIWKWIIHDSNMLIFLQMMKFITGTKKKKSWNGKFPINTVSHFPHTSTIRQIDKSKKKVRKFREVEAPAQTVEGSSFQTGHSSTRTTSMTPGVHQKEQARAAVFGAVADPWEDWGEGLGNKEWIYIGKQKVYIFRNIEYNNLPLVIHSSIYQSTSTILVSILPIYCHSTNEWGAELWSSD